MKKVIKTIFSFCCVIFIVTACDKNSRIVFPMENGEIIKIKFDNDQGYEMTQSVPINFLKDSKIIAEANFINQVQYETYEKVIIKSELTNIIHDVTNEKMSYIILNYNKSNYYAIVKILNSNYSLFIRNAESDIILKECIERIKL